MLASPSSVLVCPDCLILPARPHLPFPSHRWGTRSPPLLSNRTMITAWKLRSLAEQGGSSGHLAAAVVQWAQLGGNGTSMLAAGDTARRGADWGHRVCSDGGGGAAEGIGVSLCGSKMFSCGMGPLTCHFVPSRVTGRNRPGAP